jgi:uncharacterized protein with PQ loop repeat
MENEGVNYQLKGIEILDIQLNYPSNFKPSETKFRFDFVAENKVNVEKGMVLVVPTIKIYNDKSAELLGSIRVNFAFHVQDFSTYIDEENKKVELPKAFQLAINSVSISTIRGIMYSQFRGTFLQNAILPVIDPNTLLQGK